MALATITLKVHIQYQDQFGVWRHYQTQHHQPSAFRTATQRAHATGKRHRLVDEDGCLLERAAQVGRREKLHTTLLRTHARTHTHTHTHTHRVHEKGRTVIHINGRGTVSALFRGRKRRLLLRQRGMNQKPHALD